MNLKRILRVNFVDFWDNFYKRDNYFYHLLSQKYEVLIDENNPDIVFGSFFNQRKGISVYQNHPCLKVYYTGENDGLKDFPYDVCITQHRIEENDKHFRIPLWVLFTSWFEELNFIHHRDPSYLVTWGSLDKSKLDLEKIVESKKRFCSFIYADLTSERKYWYDTISNISRVDAAGSALNNCSGTIPGRGDQIYKLSFLSDFLFSLSIENSRVNGYATEKILHPMSTLTIPLYWGDPNIQEDFNVDSFVDLRKTTNEVLEEVKELLANKKYYLDKLSKSWFLNDHSKRYKEHSLNFIENSMNKKNETMGITL